MYKTAVIGDRESVMGFMAAGLTVIEADDAQEAAKELRRLCRSEEYAVIFITEKLAAQITQDTDRYRSKPIPAIIPIPGKEGSLGFGLENIKKSVERAVGADILK